MSVRLIPVFLMGCTSSVELGVDRGPGGSESATGVGTPASCDGGVCVLPTEADRRVGYHQLVIDDDGVAWVSWVEVVGLSPESVWIARSAAPGLAIGEAIEVPVAEMPTIGSSEKPSLAVRDGRFAMAYTGIGDLRHGDAYAIYVQLGDLVDGVPVFSSADKVEQSGGDQWVMEQARVSLAGGEAAVLYKRQIYGVRDVATLARESDGFVPVEVNEALSQRHDCSPPDLRAGNDDRLWIGLRNNIDGWLETVIFSPDDVEGEPVQVSDDGWRYSDTICPDDGPRVAQLADGTLVTLWVAPSGETWRSFYAYSTDDGRTWSDQVFDHERGDLGERWPTITALPDGRILTTSEWLTRETSLFLRDEVDGVGREQGPLTGPNGERLEEVEVATGGGRTAALGLGEEGRLWLVEL